MNPTTSETALVIFIITTIVFFFVFCLFVGIVQDIKKILTKHYYQSNNDLREIKDELESICPELTRIRNASERAEAREKARLTANFPIDQDNLWESKEKR